MVYSGVRVPGFHGYQSGSGMEELMDKVWVLVIEHNQGTNVEVHRTERGAQDSLVAFVDEYWNGAEPRIEDDSERVEFYFENSFDEFYSIQEAEVED